MHSALAVHAAKHQWQLHFRIRMCAMDTSTLPSHTTIMHQGFCLDKALMAIQHLFVLSNQSGYTQIYSEIFTAHHPYFVFYAFYIIPIIFPIIKLEENTKYVWAKRAKKIDMCTGGYRHKVDATHAQSCLHIAPWKTYLTGWFLTFDMQPSRFSCSGLCDK